MFPGMGGMGMGGAPKQEVKSVDTSEMVQISGLALLKMIKHARAGVPLEVMGIMLGQYVDDYTIHVRDVFSMPQVGTAVSVESVDDVYQKEFQQNLNQTGRTDLQVGWYHSHPGLGCWLSSTDTNTAQSYENLDPRSVSLVIDPIQSVRGKVVMDCFRCIQGGESAALMKMFGMGGSSKEPRHSTSNLGFIAPVNQAAQVRGLDQGYYSINSKFKQTELETQMLLNLYKQKWKAGIQINNPSTHSDDNLNTIKNMSKISKDYTTWVSDEMSKTKEQLKIRNVGKVDPKKHLEQNATDLMIKNVHQIMGSMINTKIF